MKKVTLVFVVLLVLLSFVGCTVESPYPEDMWTQNIYPGIPNIYHVGSNAYPYNSGHFTNLYINGHLYNGGVVSTTYVVAANNSVDAYRADYQCTGVNDQTVIQTALNALPAGGGRVILLEGTYNTTENIQVPQYAVLEGQGFNSYILANGAGLTQVIEVVGDEVVIKNLKIEIASGCGVAGARPNGIYCQFRGYIAIDHIRIIGDTSVAQEPGLAQQNGVYLEDSSYSYVVNCIINNCKRSGISCIGVSEAPFSNSFINNSVYNNVDSGIYISKNLEVLIDSNQCHNNTLRGIMYYWSNKGTISNNNCALNDHYGINVYQNATNTVISGNNCSDNDWTGIRVAGSSIGNTVVGNVCNDNIWSGIHIYDYSDYCTVTGNTCTINGIHGVYIDRSNHCSITGNICVGNTGDGINVYGISAVDTANYNIVNSNVCYNNGGDGVEIDGDFSGGHNYAVSNIVTDNQLAGNAGLSLNNDGTTTLIADNVT